ncbi:MAG TPA: hypothetical protein VFK15_15835, partial [Burkholderiales bacterium]|nr:hypothetical protein [Burkholderiales bacterium]
MLQPAISAIAAASTKTRKPGRTIMAYGHPVAEEGSTHRAVRRTKNKRGRSPVWFAAFAILSHRGNSGLGT